MYLINYIRAYQQLRQRNQNARNTFDYVNPFSYDAIVNGTLPSEEQWDMELPNWNNSERIIIYGGNSNGQLMVIELMVKPFTTINEKKYIHYEYKLLINTNLNEDIYESKESGVIINNYDTDYKYNNRYNFAGLIIQVIEPFRKIRIKFRGYLRKKDTNELIFSRIHMLWAANSLIFHYKNQFNLPFLAERFASVTGSSSIELNDILENRYAQCGQLKGVIQFDNRPEAEIYLWGCRSKQFIDPNQCNEQIIVTRVMGYSKKGNSFEINVIKDLKTNKSCCHGFGSTPRGIVLPFQSLTVNVSNIESSKTPINIKYKIDGREYTTKITNINENGFCTLTLNDQESYGIILKREKIENNNKYENLPLNFCVKKSESQKLILRIGDDISADNDITGGKGSSLSQLMVLSDYFHHQFIVPKGYIVTTNAYHLLMRDNSELNDTINKLEDRVWSENRDNLQEECTKTVEMISSAQMPNQIKEELKDAFESNGFDICNNLFAIRSSACGEDSEEMSAAGQMSTYLGVKGLNEICRAVMKCWASQFNYVAVEYKRGYGQRINTPMAVVIQEMIDCDSAGVMFTCDPITGDESKIIITANYGIGESVVSASAEPDTVNVSVNIESNALTKPRTVKDVESITIGTKTKSIKINKKTGDGTEEIIPEDSDKCCITTNDIKRLSDIAVNVHYGYGTPRDIEWGIKDSIIYLFQSRHITNLDSYTEWELIHELDTGHNDETEYYSTANVGEVMPGAMSTLFCTTILRTFRSIWKSRLENVRYNVPYHRPMPNLAINSNKIFFDLKDPCVLKFTIEEKEQFVDKAFIVAIFGSQLHGEKFNDLRNDTYERKFRESATMKENYAILKSVIGNIMFGKKHLLKFKEKFKNFSLFNGNEFKTSKEMVNHFIRNLFIVFEALYAHFRVTQTSAIYNLLIIIMLANGSDDFESNTAVLTDFAKFAANCTDVISADVPSAMNKLAQSIDETETFGQMSPEDAHKWIVNHNGKCGIFYKNFMEVYGHRGYKEFDVMSKTWKDDPLSLIQILQTLVTIKKNDDNEIVIKNDDIFNNIQTPLTGFKKFMLKNMIIPRCKQSVRDRENGKSFLIWTINVFREYLNEIGMKMAYEEKRIPEPDLIFHLTISELLHLTQKRDPKLVVKAKMKKKIHKKIDKYIYDEFSIGPVIKPQNVDDGTINKDILNNGEIIKGTPVSSGKIKGRVCVAKFIDEAKQIQSGDILVTYSTDIGWSPYFPILSGIITDIGGLISHGAVIAREYGIPCIVGVKHVCERLETGQMILLDADNGEIILIND